MMAHGDIYLLHNVFNLSGGQKQCIQLVRAVHQDSDIYLLHNVFSTGPLASVMREGMIVQSGKYNDLLDSGMDFSALVAQHGKNFKAQFLYLLFLFTFSLLSTTVLILIVTSLYIAKPISFSATLFAIPRIFNCLFLSFPKAAMVVEVVGVGRLVATGVGVIGEVEIGEEGTEGRITE
ncbi:hypothetical protein VNO78_25861 [Psophocarpus tetragonolobus]|uniref:Uncharacterized protein n=1 Tax=Psophocarpus tetragonolobus TaxID=3891 RepID=A0AAN9XFT2_PSOTE